MVIEYHLVTPCMIQTPSGLGKPVREQLSGRLLHFIPIVSVAKVNKIGINSKMNYVVSGYKEKIAL